MTATPDDDSMYLGCDGGFLLEFPSLSKRCYGVITKSDGRKFRLYSEDDIKKACIDKIIVEQAVHDKVRSFTDYARVLRELGLSDRFYDETIEEA